MNEISKRQFETALSKDFENGLSLFSGKSDSQKLSSANLKDPSTASKRTGKLSLTERLHRGTQASIRMGRRQGSQLGLSMADRPSLGDQYNDVGYGSASLGKRTHQQVPEQDIYYRGDNMTPGGFDTPGGGSAISMRRARKEPYSFTGQNMLYRQHTPDSMRFSRGDGYNSFST